VKKLELFGLQNFGMMTSTKEFRRGLFNLKTWKSPIFWRIYIINLFVIFSLVGLMVFTSYRLLPNIAEQKFRMDTDMAGLRMKDQISLIIKNIEDVASVMETNPRFKSNRMSDLNRELEKIVILSPYIDSGTILDAKGQVEGFYPKDIRLFNNRNLSGRDYFQQAVNTKKIYIGGVSSVDTGHYAINIAVPILDPNQKIIRVICLALHIEENPLFQSALLPLHIGKSGYTYIVDQKGSIIIHPQKERIGENVSQNPVVAQLMRKQSGYQHVMNTKGIAMLASYQYVPVLNWGIVAQVPIEETYESYYSFRIPLWIFSFFCILFLSFLTALYATRIIKPIQKLYMAVDQVAKGNYEQRVDKIDRSEIGDLSARFNEMIDYIRFARADLHEKENQLWKQKEFLRQVIDLNPNYIYAKNRDGKFTLVNQSFANLLNLNPEDLIGRREKEFYPYLSDQEGDENANFIPEEMIEDWYGEMHWVQTVCLPIVSTDGFADQTLFVSTDITERKKTEEFLRKSEKLSVVGELAAGVAHEIRNPLTSLKGFVQLMQTSNGGNPRYLEIMQAELERINFIVSEFLMLSKPQVIHFQAKQIELIMKDVIALLDTQAILSNIQFNLACDEEGLFIQCEENQLKQVFVNLLKNAMEAMPQGGEIKVSLKHAGNKVKILITDQGCGIPPEQIQKLGEPFYTTKEKGTGLGMMVSFKIVEAHKGTIRIESEMGTGTTVELVFPLTVGAMTEIGHTTV
jgi:two-component system, sporulation sensor kinase A